MCISNISFQLVPRPSSGTQPENLDIPHTGPLLGAPYHSRLPDRSSTSHEQLEQSGIPARLSVVVSVVVDKEQLRSGRIAAADKAASLLLASQDGLVPVKYMLRSYHVPVEVFLVETVVEQAA